MTELIILAGATGRLGKLIAKSLRQRNANVRALIRRGSTSDTSEIESCGVELVKVDFFNSAELTAACRGGSCVVSALSGVGDVILDVQSQLLDAALKAGVPRFMPSDYAVDFNCLDYGTNRNFDLRRKFKERLDAAPVAATSILNGMFTDLLTGPAPVILFKFKRVLYWENPDQLMDFTTIENTAEYTAAAAMDPSTPRWFRIAGDEKSARDLVNVVSEVTGERFKLTRAGGLGRLAFLTKVMRLVAPGGHEAFPPWQGMQYLHNMFEGKVKFDRVDNERYPGIEWTSVRDVIASARSIQ